MLSGNKLFLENINKVIICFGVSLISKCYKYDDVNPGYNNLS